MLFCQGDVFIHLDLIQASVDPLEEAIRHSWHAFYTGDERDMIRGVSWHHEAPFMLLRRQVKAGMGSQSTYFDKARERGHLADVFASAFGTDCIDDIPDDDNDVDDDDDDTDTDGDGRLSGIIDLDGSYDKMACRRRAERLFLNIPEEDLMHSKVSFEPYEQYSREPTDDGSGRRYVSRNAVNDVRGLLDRKLFSRVVISQMFARDREANSHMYSRRPQPEDSFTREIFLSPS